jgi:hypothetical protein
MSTARSVSWENTPSAYEAPGWLATYCEMRPLTTTVSIHNASSTSVSAASSLFSTAAASSFSGDINKDGTLDQSPDVLAALDIVVASVHSKLRSPGDLMTKRMLAGIEDPNMNIMGHCTGRIVLGRGRPQSEFDHAAVFTACKDNDIAVEINSRPERKDPPRNCPNWPSISAASSQSIPMHTRRDSSSGSTSAATAPPSVVSPKTA